MKPARVLPFVTAPEPKPPQPEPPKPTGALTITVTVASRPPLDPTGDGTESPAEDG